MSTNTVSKTAKTVLFSEMTPEPEWEGEFNAWYDQEHIPLRMGAPGFTGAQRYRNVAAADYLAVYEMTSPEALSTPEYQKIKGQPSDQTRRMLHDVSGFTRYIGVELGSDQRADAQRPEDAPILYSVFFKVPEEAEADFNGWYEQDHAPILLKCSDWLMVRRFKIVSGDPEAWTHMALHYLADRSALESPERAEARATPWRARLAAQPWFNGKYTVFEKRGSRFTAAK
jgi:hypothetical protein